MKLYEETVRCDVNLPIDANEFIDRETQRTGIQKAVFLRCIILKWFAAKTKDLSGEENP